MSKISASIAGRDVFHLSMPTLSSPSISTSADESAKRMKELGYVARHRLQEIPDWIFFGTDPQYLYLREEIPFQFPVAKDAVRNGFVRQVQNLERAMKKKGVTFIALPVPTKVSIEKEHLPSTLPPESIWGKTITTAAIRRGPHIAHELNRLIVDAAPNAVVDLYTKMQLHKQTQPKAPIFLPGDTHWSSLGISLAVIGILEKLRENGWKISVPILHSTKTFHPDKNHDLYAALQLPQWFTYSDETLYQVAGITRRHEKGEKGRIIIAGSSFSERLSKTAYGLGPQLARVLNRELIDSSVSGGGANEGLRHLKQRGITLQSGDLLIWEFPIRSPLSRDVMPTEP